MSLKLRSILALALLAILAGVVGAARAVSPDRPTTEGGAGSTDFAINLLPGGMGPWRGIGRSVPCLLRPSSAPASFPGCREPMPGA